MSGSIDRSDIQHPLTTGQGPKEAFSQSTALALQDRGQSWPRMDRPSDKDRSIARVHRSGQTLVLDSSSAAVCICLHPHMTFV